MLFPHSLKTQQTATVPLHLLLPVTSLSSVCLVPVHQLPAATLCSTQWWQMSLCSLQMNLKVRRIFSQPFTHLLSAQSSTTTQSSLTETDTRKNGSRRLKSADFLTLHQLLMHCHITYVRKILICLSVTRFTTKQKCVQDTKSCFRNTQSLLTSKALLWWIW